MTLSKLIKAIVVFLSVLPVSVFAQEWRVEVPIYVERQSVVEVPLMAELHSQAQDGFDLKVIGPDGKSRTFELYWREEKNDSVLQLEQFSSRLENQVFIWTAKIPEKNRINVKSLKISVLSGEYIGKVDIFGLINGRWKKLADKAALYEKGGATQGEIEIEKARYEEFRMEFSAYAKKPVPIGKVQARGDDPDRGYAEVPVPLKFQRIDSSRNDNKDMSELIAVLPGSGLYIKELELISTVRFNGDWSLENQTLAGGKKTYVPVINGSISGLGKGSASIKIGVVLKWEGNVMNLRLISPEGSISEVKNLSLKIRVPYLVFLADMPGAYLVQTGWGNKVHILENPTARRMPSTSDTRFGPARSNPDWKPESLIRQYQIGGAPFKSDGYEWISSIKLADPGYYRFVLHQKASLDENLPGLRVVRDAKQIPYFTDRGESKEVILPVTEKYDKEKNTSYWHLELPQTSSRWSELKLKAGGIFSRTLRVERDRPQMVQGVLCTSKQWINRSQKESELFVSLKCLPREEKNIRLVMAHGDNKPVSIKEAKAVYYAPALYFLAEAGDGYELYGGSTRAALPSYDLELVQSHLMSQEPKTAGLAEPRLMKEQGITNKFFRYFSEKNWGLYIVLGLLVIGLMVVIAYLFPKPIK